MFSGAGVEASVPQIVIRERTVTLDDAKPTFGQRRILRSLRGRDQIVAWLNAVRRFDRTFSARGLNT